MTAASFPSAREHFVLAASGAAHIALQVQRADRARAPDVLYVHGATFGAASSTRRPPAVLVPSGPVADIAALWSGQALYDPARVSAPTLLVRGEWDSLCADVDAQRLCSAMTCAVQDVKIPRGTHLLHLERQRSELHAAVNGFLAAMPAPRPRADQQQVSAG